MEETSGEKLLRYTHALANNSLRVYRILLIATVIMTVALIHFW